MPFSFYGSSRGGIYDRLRARRDPAHVPPPLRMVSLPSQSIVLPVELEDPS